MSTPEAVGLRTLAVPEGRAWALYPGRGEARHVAFGPYAVEVAEGAEPVGTRLPVVVVSHGKTGSPWTYRGLALAIARSGFVVALVEHAGDNRADPSRTGTLANLEARPRMVRSALDALASDDVLRDHADPARAAVVGHSIGAYTALAVAGGRPWCGPDEAPDGAPRAVDVTRDPRVRTLVLLAPAAFWYAPSGSLSSVDVPILLRTGEKDAIAPGSHGHLVVAGVARPELVDHVVVPNAGHFSFQSPFPEAMRRPDFPPANDPEGFDRSAYEPVLAREVVAFLQKNLA